MPTAHVHVEGKVQGVFFRKTTRERAEELGVAGWVRNLHDGRVEAVFQGPEEDVQRMIAFCREGPTRARVEDVDVRWMDDGEAAALDGFERRPTA